MSPKLHQIDCQFGTFSVSLSSSAPLKVLAVSQAFIELGLEPFHTVAILGHNDPCWHIRWSDDHDIDIWHIDNRSLALGALRAPTSRLRPFGPAWLRPLLTLLMVMLTLLMVMLTLLRICWCFSFLPATWLRCMLVVLQLASTRPTGGKIYLPDWSDISARLGIDL